MPIRFRCAYCNQLLGIARRKAGTVVRCPTCAGQVVVPNTEPEGMDAPAGPEQPIFERSDFDQVFKVSAEPRQPVLSPASPSPAKALPPPAGAWGTHAEPSFDVERLDPAQVPQATPGPGAARVIVLSSSKATLFVVGAILAVAVAFGIGLMVGQMLK
jgi:DNA-directed RNA polymerase subunit RPC12/RpoP